MREEVDYLSMTDEALVARSHAGDTRADEALYERYKNVVRMKARPYFLIGADREDLVQEGMIGLYKAIRDYTPDHNAGFRSFAEMCIVRQLNTYVSFYGSAYSEEEKERTLLDTMATVRTESPEDAFISKENMERILSSIEKLLTPLEKQVLDLFMDGYSYQQIAAMLGRGTKTVDNALQRIKRKLEKYLQEE